MGKPLRVLMVEDSEDDILLTIHALKKGGYEPVYERVETAEAMRKAQRDQEKFTRQVERLNGEVRTEKLAIEKLEGEKKKLVEEEAFLRTYVKQADSNVKKLAEVLDKIIAADAARAAADAAAAKAAKADKNS